MASYPHTQLLDSFVHHSNQAKFVDLTISLYHRTDYTGWRRLIGSLIVIGHFLQKWLTFSGYVVENDLQLRGSHESSPTCSTASYRLHYYHYNTLLHDSCSIPLLYDCITTLKYMTAVVSSQVLWLACNSSPHYLQHYCITTLKYMTPVVSS